jgi:hypothetical protein
VLAAEGVTQRGPETRRVSLLTYAPCTFTDQKGRTFEGKRRVDVWMDATPLPAPAREAALVRIEVDGGQGAIGREWVATKIEPIEPLLDLPATLRDARTRFFEAIRSRQAELAAKASRIRAPASDCGEPGAPAGKSETIAVPVDETTVRYAWLGPARRVRIALANRRGLRWNAARLVVHTYDCPPGAPCMPPHSECVSSSGGEVWELVGHYEYDATGARVSEEIVPLRRGD